MEGGGERGGGIELVSYMQRWGAVQKYSKLHSKYN